MKKVLFFLIVTFIFVPIPSFALETIPFKTTIENVVNKVQGTITYEVVGNLDNTEGVVNPPTEIVVDFSDINVENHTVTKESIVDFSNTVFPVSGTYKFGFRQQKTNHTSVILSDKTYEIFVQVTLEDDGTLTKEVSPLAVDFEDMEKKTLEFVNDTKYSYIALEHHLDGDFKDFDKNTYFQYRISIDGPKNDIYTILGQDEQISYEGRIIETSSNYFVTKEDNYLDIYIKGNQTITIGIDEDNYKEIPLKVNYTIRKRKGEKWLTYIDSEEGIEKTFQTGEKVTPISITEKRDYDSAITGVFYNVLPYLILLIFLIVGIYFFQKWKIKTNEKM